MPRPSLPIGTWGKIRRTEKGPDLWVATAQFRDSDGVTRPVTASGKTGAAAERALKERLTSRAAPEGDLITRDMRLTKLADFLFDELEQEGKLTKQTIDGYKRTWERDALAQLGQLRIREATVGRIDKHIKTLAKDYTSKPRHVKVVLGKMFDLAVRHGACDANPVRSTTRVAKPKKVVRTIDLRDLNAVRDAIRVWQSQKRPGPKDYDLADIIDTFLGTGARIGEVLAILWDDVDLAAEPPTVTISGTLVEVKGEPLFRQPWTKTDAGYRTLVMPKFLVDVLMRRMVEAPALNPYAAVFVTRKGTWKSPNNVRRQWRAARKGTGFEWVTPHIFRKTVATLIDDQVDAAAASKVLGHASEDVTKEYYIAKPALAPDVSKVMEAHLAPSRAQDGSDTA